MDKLTIVGSTHGWRVVPDGIVRHFVRVRYAHIALVTTSGQNFSLLYTLLWSKGLLGERHGRCRIIFITDWVCRTLVELVMVLELLGLLLTARFAALAEVWVWDRGESTILRFNGLEGAITALWLRSRVRIKCLHLCQVIFWGLVLLLSPTHILLFRLDVVD